ncbi:ABC transporter ATP-binding protein [Chlorobaculum thiosulfatiphilum]|uniref:ABC transporter ATP-binding protein n=1 Tax=Chlorobaculum thiosulfatiphilum TaxID=115852 RepID=A0A5C4SBG2_CHLTI|nr:ABC transporter ATP-binding protein [Chlorobaculum thiosulfatiphilum]TNJ40259.1 ABC transporter ATP-binding protein [Chlorobaculum thiosulfatiphilum]
MPGSTDRLKPALAFRGVTAGYKGRTVLREVGFEIAEGEFVSVIGPNGSGKSTMLKTATGLLKPLEGRVELFGREVSSLKPRERASLIGVVPQKLESPMAFTVAEIVMIGRSVRGRWGGPDAADHDSAERAMIYTNVLDLKDRLFNQLSAGEQQRTALAMALAQEPRIIMLDESIAHLDINHSQEVLRILMNINREEKITVLLVSHDLNLAAQIADRLMLIDKGRLVRNGSPGEVMEEELLRRVYDCDLRVRRDPFSGNPVVSGVLDAALRRPPARKRLHVISGGGSGIELFRRLLIEGFDLTAGVLNRLDSDSEAARALDIPAVLEQPFSPVGGEALSQARRMVEAADGLVAGLVPFGPGNLVNLDLAELALKAGKPVWLAAGIASRDYTPGKAAAAKARELCDGGAVEWSNIHELMARIEQTWPQPETQH